METSNLQSLTHELPADVLAEALPRPTVARVNVHRRRRGQAIRGLAACCALSLLQWAASAQVPSARAGGEVIGEGGRKPARAGAEIIGEEGRKPAKGECSNEAATKGSCLKSVRTPAPAAKGLQSHTGGTATELKGLPKAVRAPLASAADWKRLVAAHHALVATEIQKLIEQHGLRGSAGGARESLGQLEGLGSGTSGDRRLPPSGARLGQAWRT